MQFSGNIFLTGAIFFTFCELSSQCVLEQLFEGSHGFLFPRAESKTVFPEFQSYSQILFKYQQAGSPTSLHVSSRLAVRGHVVIGVMEGGYIRPVTPETGGCYFVYIILEGGRGDWVQVTRKEAEKLGVGQRLLFVQTIDEIVRNHLMNRSELREEEYPRRLAHSEAIGLLCTQEEENRASNLPVDPETMKDEYYCIIHKSL